MPDAHLKAAHDELERAMETADDDVREPLHETASAFSEYVTGDREADYALFDSHLNTLRQAAQNATDETETHIDNALEHAEAVRMDLEQA